MTNAVDADIISEMKAEPSTFDLGAFISSNVQFPTKDVKVILDMQGSMEAYDLEEEIADLVLDKQAIEAEAEGGITGGDTEEIELRISAKTLELSNLVDELDKKALTFTLRGAAPKVWRIMHKKARQDFKLPKDATQEATQERNIQMNEYVDVETVRLCTSKITNPDGEVIEGTEVTAELIRALYDALEQTEWDKLKDTAEAITFQVGAFDKVISQDADFLPQSSVSETTEDI